MGKDRNTTRLRKLFASESVIRIVGAHNALGAKLAERAGFDGLWSSGLEISTSHAVPDANILTMSEYLAVAASMVDSVKIPVVADCDTGYGNASNVIHMVRKFEAAGVAAVCIEDKFFPKLNSFVSGRQPLASIGEFVGKILAAKNAQRDPDFMVIGRVEALIAGWGLEEALKRAYAYARAGADAILIHSKSKNPGQIIEFLHNWDLNTPIVVVPTTYYSITAHELEKLGVKMIIYANQGLRIAIRTVEATFRAILKNGTTAPIEDQLAPLKDVFELQGMPKMMHEEEIYLRSGIERTRAVIPAAGDHLGKLSITEIASDIPIPMLDINGKPLLQLQRETLNQAGISDVTVICGYKEDLVHVDGVKKVSKHKWYETGEMESIMSAGPDFDKRTLIVNSDILFDIEALERLLKSKAIITILVDRTYNREDYRPGQSTDLAVLDGSMGASRRHLGLGWASRVTRIGQEIPPEEATCEFTGLALFNVKGFMLMKDIYKEIKGRAGGGPFHEASSPENASLADVLQEIINQGHEVAGIEISSGWMEIHSLKDFKLACEVMPI